MTPPAHHGKLTASSPPRAIAAIIPRRASAQLLSTLHESVTRALSSRRPLLTHLNADTTWLISIPYPGCGELKSSLGKAYFHILVDPWLRGGQYDVAKFFSQQWHVEESCVQTVEGIEEVIRDIEEAARRGEGFSGSNYGPGRGGDDDVGTAPPDRMEEGSPRSFLDAVVVSHEFTDHMHKETLLEVPFSVPVLATSKAASEIRSWSHFASVLDIPRFDGDWRHSSATSLPDWISVSRVAYPGNDLLYYHSAVMVTFPSGNQGGGGSSSSSIGVGETEAEAIIYTPHGISPENVLPVAAAQPKIHTLALLHGLQDIQIKAKWSLEAQLNKGAHNGLKIVRALGAKYWVGTHDEVKTGGGIVSWFLARKAIGLKEAVERERLEMGEGGGEGAFGELRFEELGNGESLILE